jgi:hypothetical protein
VPPGPSPDIQGSRLMHEGLEAVSGVGLGGGLRLEVVLGGLL